MQFKPLFFFFFSILAVYSLQGQVRLPVVESHIEGFDPSVNQLNVLHSSYPQLNGKKITISIKEQKLDSGDIDFKGRFKPSSLASDFITTHATQMATLAAGGGNSSDYSKGAAWNAWVSSSSFLNLMPDADDYFQSSEISIQNHSYGTGIEPYYGEDATAYDAQANRRRDLLHIFSAGNVRDQQNSSGKYQGLYFANISGSFKMSKNTLLVGAVDGSLNVAQRSSRGPAHDGRIKPELVAYGLDGSSGAAAITSGISAVLQQQFSDKYDSLPPSSLIRGILMNTAEDLLIPGPDFTSGFGNVQALNALSIINQGNFILSDLNNIEEKIFEVEVPADLKQLRCMLSWIDPPATAEIEKALIHDLNLKVENPSGNIFYPWVLSHFPNSDSLLSPAFRGIDTLNNQEQVTIDNPFSGRYKITVSSADAYRLQDFALNWYFDKDSLFWTFPVKGDKVERNKEVILRWSQPLKINSTLQILNSGIWENLGIIPTGSKMFGINANLKPGVYQLRINNGNDFLITDSFTISDLPVLRVGYLCPDSTLLYWNPSQANNYNIKHLPGNYLSDLAVVQDTIFISASGPDYYAVSQMYDGLEGLRSLTINPALQGIGCYVSNFLADLVNEEGRLTLQLATGIGISEVKLQKLIGNVWITIDSSEVNSSLGFRWNDPAIFRGTNYYRVEINLGTRNVYSRVESLFFFNSKDVILYPNPVPSGSPLRIATADTEELLVEFFDGIGRKVFTYGPVETIEQVPTAKLRSGIFFYRISRNGKRIGSGRLVVQ
jgi:hypothetical protein